MKFKEAMADPEFQSMLKDYMEEMQDPAVRAVRAWPLHVGLREGDGELQEGDLNMMR